MLCTDNETWQSIMTIIEEHIKKDKIIWEPKFYQNPFTCKYLGTFKNSNNWICFTLFEQRILLTSNMCSPLNITMFTDSVEFINRLTEKINRQNLIKLQKKLFDIYLK